MALRWMKQSASELTYMNWDGLRFRQQGKTWWGISHTLALNNPLSHTKAETGEKFGKAQTLEEELEALGAELTTTDLALPVKDISARWDVSHPSRFPAPWTNQARSGSTISSGRAHYSGGFPSKRFTSLATQGGNTPLSNEGENHDPT